MLMHYMTPICLLSSTGRRSYTALIERKIEHWNDCVIHHRGTQLAYRPMYSQSISGDGRAQVGRVRLHWASSDLVCYIEMNEDLGIVLQLSTEMRRSRLFGPPLHPHMFAADTRRSCSGTESLKLYLNFARRREARTEPLQPL